MALYLQSLFLEVGLAGLIALIAAGHGGESLGIDKATFLGLKM